MGKVVAYIDFIRELDDGTYKIEGYLGGDATKYNVGDQLRITVGGSEFTATFVERKNTRDGVEYDTPIAHSTFEVAIRPKLSRRTPVDIWLEGRSLPIKMNRFTRLSRLVLSYRIDQSAIWIIRGSHLMLAPYTKGCHLWLELASYGAIVCNWRLGDGAMRLRQKPSLKTFIKAVVIVGEALLTIPEALLIRTIYLVRLRTKKLPLWLLSDRPMAAGDNGEAFYRYIVDNPLDTNMDCYFVLSKKSPDYARLKSFGRVLHYGSFRYKLAFLLSDKIISSQADIETTNAFGRQINRYLDLFHFQFVFLQHGVIRHDLSNWLNRFNRNIDIFITSAKIEQNSIINGEYYYAPDQVVLTGLPRYDLLQSNPQSKLILAPTYRANLLTSGINGLGERTYDNRFKQSAYAIFYDNFMNDERLIKCMKQHGFSGELYLHPVFKNQVRDFTANSTFTVASFPYNYNRAFETGSLLVSDHSSLTFDFAYLKKPVIYAYFDADHFYATHTYTKSDFFRDDQQGFGPVCDDYESLIAQTIATIEQGTQMSQKYQQRVDAFFEYNDKSNSERVFAAIMRSKNNVGS